MPPDLLATLNSLVQHRTGHPLVSPWRQGKRVGGRLSPDSDLQAVALPPELADTCRVWIAGEAIAHSSGAGTRSRCIWGRIFDHPEAADAFDKRLATATRYSPDSLSEQLKLDKSPDFSPLTRRDLIRQLATQNLASSGSKADMIPAAAAFVRWLQITPSQLLFGPGLTGTVEHDTIKLCQNDWPDLAVRAGGKSGTYTLTANDPLNRQLPLCTIHDEHDHYRLVTPPHLATYLCCWHALRLPFHLAPEQVAITAVAPAHEPFAETFLKRLREAGWRVTGAPADSPLRPRVARLLGRAIPYVVVIGEREAKDGKLAVRCRECPAIRRLEPAIFEAELRRLSAGKQAM